MKTKKILIANRGEIASRVISTCKKMGFSTVVIYSEEDKNSLIIDQADYAFSLGAGTLAETYLNQEKILSICLEAKVDGVHPGYGFLSENTDFAALLEKNNITFIGPRSESIKLMGDKAESKKFLEENKMPVIPGYHGEKQDPDFLKQKAQEIGFPILVKATAGGGGKGMRIVHQVEKFDEELIAAKSEAKKSFSNDTVLIEKYISNPKHIEVQVVGDGKGKAWHFYERECSVQRRYQKIIEESPSPFLTSATRKKICETGVMLAEKINYRGAGTIEFILDCDSTNQEFYFLEMNTRLQVEHPITEMVTGADLVQWQLNVAFGNIPKINQEEIKQLGHSIECRLYAEDPDNNFFPSVGKIDFLSDIILKDFRLETGVRNGDEITTAFDPMILKLVVWGEDREKCVNQMKSALERLPILGFKTNREYLRKCLEIKEFISGEYTTNLITQKHQEICDARAELAEDEIMALLACHTMLNHDGGGERTTPIGGESSVSVFESIRGLRSF
ncbi:ATP-grasp domain-containing protein [Bacteriovoracaceae bacterium]|nr:ATP-grasp domain-containing protein [Bacteriovoracaceae bacterium]